MPRKLDPDTAEKFAVQTAVLATIVELLISKDCLGRESVLLALYNLLSSHEGTGAKQQNGGAIRHLIAILERDLRSGLR
jgi:hypothetical protein